jgi:hypothetical protein
MHPQKLAGNFLFPAETKHRTSDLTMETSSSHHPLVKKGQRHRQMLNNQNCKFLCSAAIFFTSFGARGKMLNIHSLSAHQNGTEAAWKKLSCLSDFLSLSLVRSSNDKLMANRYLIPAAVVVVCACDNGRLGNSRHGPPRVGERRSFRNLKPQALEREMCLGVGSEDGELICRSWYFPFSSDFSSPFCVCQCDFSGGGDLMCMLTEERVAEGVKWLFAVVMKLSAN